MNELEERLRADLLTATRGIDSDLDEQAVLASAHRTRYDRTVRRVASVTALALATAVIGWAGLSAQLSRGTAPVLATPLPSTPAPSPSTSRAVGAKGSVTFRKSDYSLSEGAGLTSVTISATLNAAGGYDGQVMVVAKNGSTSAYPLPSAANNLAWVQVTPRLVVGLVPHQVDWIQYLDLPGGDGMGAVSSNDQVIDGLDATAYYRLFETKGTYPGSEGYLWRDQEGAFRNGTGAVVPSITLKVPGLSEERAFYEDVAGNTIGVTDGSGSVSMRVHRDQVQAFPGYAGKDGESAVTAIVLPVGASRPELVSTASDLTWAVGELSGRVAILAGAHLASTENDVVTKVRYTDASGNRVTEPLK